MKILYKGGREMSEETLKPPSVLEERKERIEKLELVIDEAQKQTRRLEMARSLS